jgi:hypothetical protein
MFAPVERRPGDIKFTPLWWLSAILLLASGVITFFVREYHKLGSVLLIVSMAILIFAAFRSRRRAN